MLAAPAGLELEEVSKRDGGHDLAMLICDFKRLTVDFLLVDNEVRNYLAGSPARFFFGLVERSKIDSLFVKIVAIV